MPASTSRLRVVTLAFATLVACGPSPSAPVRSASPGSAAPAAQKGREWIFDDFVLREVEHRWARVARGCAQVIVLRVPAKGFRWGEAIWIEAHADHRIAGQIQFGVGLDTPRSVTFFSNYEGPQSADDVGDDARCHEVAAAPSASGSAGGGAGASGKPGPAASGSSRPPGPALPPETAEIGFDFDPSITGDARPPRTIFRHEFQHEVYLAKPDLEAPPLPVGAEIEIKLWGMRPIDWSGVAVEIVRYRLDPKDDRAWRTKLDERWAKQIEMREKNEAASKEWQAKWSAHVEDCRKRLKDADCADVARVFAPRPAGAPEPRTTNTPPPAPRAETPTPKPSDGAIWIGGHWAWDGARWSYWSPGHWKVPDDDRTGKRTPTAPKAPPPPRAETPGTPPVPGAVWTPGYWHWQASAWLWLDGAWRVPPVAGARWRGFEWRVEASGSVRLDPGGWVLP